ncbi:signal peptidase I [bacterium]|nr:signal peptidase I [candidate division CSSED10-310 bacterium]
MKRKKTATSGEVDSRISQPELARGKFGGLSGKIKKELKEWARSILFALLFVIIFNQYFFKAYKVEGISMQPLLQDGQRIFVNRYLYSDPLPLLDIELPWRRDPQHGDVVVFWFPEEPKKSYIKRVLGVPHDRIEIRNGVFYINNRRVDDSFIPAAFKSYGNMSPLIVPKGYYFCVGDHRNRSYDSRAWGAVPKKYIIGKAFFRYWPLTAIGGIHYNDERPFFVDEPA